MGIHHVSVSLKFTDNNTMLLTGIFKVAFIGTALAVTPITDGQMSDLLNAGGVSLAMLAQPMWFFGQALNHPPCYPTWATQNGQQTASGALCSWPDAGCHCRNPGVSIGNAGPDFPIYYSYQKCTATEIRVAYNVFYEKDG